MRYPFRVSSGQSADGNATRVHFNVDPGARALSVDLDGVLSFEARAPRFEGAVTLATPAASKAMDDTPIPPWRISAKVKADPTAARLEQLEASYGGEDNALKLSGTGDIRFGASPLLRANLAARQLDADKFVAKETSKETSKETNRKPTRKPTRQQRAGPPIAGPACIGSGASAGLAGPGADRTQRRADHAGRPSVAEFFRRSAGRCQILDHRQTGFSRARCDARHPRRHQRPARQSGRRAQCRLFGSRRAGDVAAGSRRGGLSQPEAVAPARQCDGGLRPLCHRSHEGRRSRAAPSRDGSRFRPRPAPRGSTPR